MNFFNLIDPDVSKIKGQVVSIIGGGGKTSLMQKIAEELLNENLDVILTTTTRIEPLESAGLVLQKDNPNVIAEIKALLREMSIALVASDYYREGERVIGVDKIFVHKLKDLADVVLVEADGSRRKAIALRADSWATARCLSSSTNFFCWMASGDPLSGWIGRSFSCIRTFSAASESCLLLGYLAKKSFR